MDTREYRTIDKSAWEAGLWQDEPDKKQWQDEATGLPCLIVRGPSGALCGYVGVAEGHPAFGKGYDDVDVEVHGGITFADKCADTTDESKHICHVPAPGEPDHVWWLGFDCAHAGDFCPGSNYRLPEHLRDREGMPTGWGDVIRYRGQDYVERQCARLAKQLANLA